MDSHSSWRIFAYTLMQPTRTTGRRIAFALKACRPYSVLLPVGFTMPPMLPPARCALTAPFLPYRAEAAAVCFLLHCPSTCAGRMLSGTVSRWSPDFPLLHLAAQQRLSSPLANQPISAPPSYSSKSFQRSARHSPSTSPSIFSGRKRR